jgi:nucleoside-diphosphate-sugar epimerase
MEKTDNVQTKARCLVTGGAGFIGSHVAALLSGQ